MINCTQPLFLLTASRKLTKIQIVHVVITKRMGDSHEYSLYDICAENMTGSYYNILAGYQVSIFLFNFSGLAILSEYFNADVKQGQVII